MTYTLAYGIWNNAHNINSRDYAEPSQHASEAEAYAALEKERSFLQGIGYEVWWSQVTPSEESEQ